MNIFYTNPDPFICADEHCNVHQVKMILEYAQLLSTAHHLTGSGTPDMLKATHINHPCAKWVRDSMDNYEWLLLCWYKLLMNFYRRTGRAHSVDRMKTALSTFPRLPRDMLKPHPLCVQSTTHQIDPCETYQLYLNNKFQEWIDRPRQMRVEFQYGEPEWLSINRR